MDKEIYRSRIKKSWQQVSEVGRRFESLSEAEEWCKNNLEEGDIVTVTDSTKIPSVPVARFEMRDGAVKPWLRWDLRGKQ